MHLDLDRDLSTAEVVARVRDQGFATITAAAMTAGVGDATVSTLAGWWDDLALDQHLRDGGHYRRRRHGCAIVDVDRAPPHLTPVPHRAHWQSTSYNALHGGIERWFEPLADAMTATRAWSALLLHFATVFAAVRRPDRDRFFVEAHPFRIDTAGGVGRPTPEGAHRDGVDFVAVILVARHQIRGGETRVFAADGPIGVRFTLTDPWSALVLDDTRVIHESTPIQPRTNHPGHRDTLVLTYRSGGFQAPAIDEDRSTSYASR
jgi:hypothetical protein